VKPERMRVATKTISPRFIVPSPFATLAAKAGEYYSELEVDVKVE